MAAVHEMNREDLERCWDRKKHGAETLGCSHRVPDLSQSLLCLLANGERATYSIPDLTLARRHRKGGMPSERGNLLPRFPPADTSHKTQNMDMTSETYTHRGEAHIQITGGNMD